MPPLLLSSLVSLSLTRIFDFIMEIENLHKRVEEALDSIRPYLAADGGNVEVVEITQDQDLKIEMKGACKTCNMSQMTIKAGIEETIRRAVPEIKNIIAVN
jgi:Fe-S cluster biogenesis protein NfuA